MRMRSSLEAIAVAVGRLLHRVRRTATPFDTDEVVRLRRAQWTVVETNRIDTLKRRLLRGEIAAKLYGLGAPRKERKAFLVIGPPAAGKSRLLVEPLASDHGALVIDADTAKGFLPEYATGSFAAAVHEESAEIAYGTVLGWAIKNGDNVVIAIVGKSVENVRIYRDALCRSGYEVHLRLLHVSPEESARRAVARLEENGRFVDPYYILNEVSSKPRRVFDTLKAEKGCVSYEAWSNEVPKGEPPVLLERYPP